MQNEIPYPSKVSEAEIQAELYNELQRAGFDARMEVPAVLLFEGKDRQPRMDVVVFRGQKPICIIECKSWTKYYSSQYQYQGYKNTKQLQKYKQFGVPVFMCGRQEYITNIVKLVSALQE